MSTLEAELNQLKEKAIQHLSSIKADVQASLETLKQFEHDYLGRSGILRQFSQKLAAAEPGEKPKLGQLMNEVKNYLTNEFNQRLQAISQAKQAKISPILFDTTIPGETKYRGHFHPLYQTFYEMCAIFKRLGFEIVYGPEIETPFYNFEALNVPKDHPSQDAFDTFYLDGCNRRRLLRSHTSPVQIRTMQQRQPPLRIIAPGKVFRSDAPSAKHFPMFHQVEGLMVDTDITFANLKSILDIFCKEIFGKDTKTRFRPSFFPFTEPSAEMDVTCVICHGSGKSATGSCPTCHGEGWLEILGCGMVHPNVFKNVSYDSEKYTGFAFGMGVERIAMLKYEINDIRLFTENHPGFLNQF